MPYLLVFECRKVRYYTNKSGGTNAGWMAKKSTTFLNIVSELHIPLRNQEACYWRDHYVFERFHHPGFRNNTVSCTKIKLTTFPRALFCLTLFLVASFLKSPLVPISRSLAVGTCSLSSGTHTCLTFSKVVKSLMAKHSRMTLAPAYPMVRISFNSSWPAVSWSSTWISYKHLHFKSDCKVSSFFCGNYIRWWRV